MGLISKKSDRLSDRANSWIRGKGFNLPEKPNFDSDKTNPPSDLSTLSDKQLNNLMNRITIYGDYIGGELAKAEIDELQATTDYEFHCAELYLSTSSRNKQKAIIVDPIAHKKLEQLNMRTARVKLLRTIWEGMDKKYKACSRDQTRRQMTFEKRNHF